MNRSAYALYILLGMLALGLLFTSLNRYAPYQRFIDLEGRIRLDDADDARPSEAAAGAHPPDGHEDGRERIDLNSADLDALTRLPGVGPVTAAAIIDYRDRSGGFRAVDQLLEVRGIGAKKLEILRDYVIIECKE
jgi:competence ComEA-like helix-hairpin-helix protein